MADDAGVNRYLDQRSREILERAERELARTEELRRRREDARSHSQRPRREPPNDVQAGSRPLRWWPFIAADLAVIVLIAILSGDARLTAVLGVVVIVVTLLFRHLFFSAASGSSNIQPQPTQRFYLEPSKRSRWVSILMIAIAIIIVLLILTNISTYFNAWRPKLDPDSPIAKSIDGLKAGGKYVISLPGEITNWFTKFMKQAEAIGTGDYYTGTVDENAKQKLGVYLEDLKPSSQEFYKDEQVTIWGTVTAKTLDPDHPIDIILICYMKVNGKDIDGRIDPAMIKELSFLEKRDLTCWFDKGKIEPGQQSAFVRATFPFTTQAYLKTYFIDKQRMQTLQRDNVDPLDFYRVPDKNPQAIYTNGPVQIGMGEILSPLIALEDSTQTKFRIGVTLENNWEGLIKKINSLYIKVPDSMELTDCSKNKIFVSVDCSALTPQEQIDLCEPTDSGFRYKRVYKLGDEATSRIRDVKDFETFECRVKVTDKDAVLGSVPLATQYLKVVANYDYELQQEIPISVKAPVGFNVYLTPSEPNKKDTVHCIGERTEAQLYAANASLFKMVDGKPVPLAQPRIIKCSGTKCELDNTLSGLDVKRGDTLGCQMSDIKGEEGTLTSKEAAAYRYTCTQKCNNIEDPGQYNDCFNTCMKNPEEIPFAASDTVTIANSPPEILIPTTTLSGKRDETVKMKVQFRDVDGADILKFGMSFSNYKQAEPQQQTVCEGQNTIAGCVQELTFPLAAVDEQTNTAEVTLSVTDGYSADEKKISLQVVP